MKKKFTILMFSLLLAVGWTNVAQAQLKVPSPVKELSQKLTAPATSKSKAVAQQEQQIGRPVMLMPEDATTITITDENGNPVTLKRSPNRGPNRATITADKTMTRAEYEAITYDWVDANDVLHTNVKITEPASDPYQIAYLLGTTYMNKNIPGLKYSAVTGQDNPYTNVDFGWDIPNNARWPGNGSGVTPTTYNDITINIPSYWLDFNYILVQSNGTTVTGGSWIFADNGTTLPSNWGGTAEFEEENSGCCVQNGGATIIIPHSIIDGKQNVTVVISGRKYSDSPSSSQCTVTISGATPESNEYTTTAYAEKTWAINPAAGSGTTSGTYYPEGLVIGVKSSNINLRSITVKSGNSTLTSWNANTAWSNNQYGSYTLDGSSLNYFTLPGWYYSEPLTRWGNSSSNWGYFMYRDQHIFIPASYLNGNSSITVQITAYCEEGTSGERITVNGEDQSVTSESSSNLSTLTWTFTGSAAPNTRTVDKPDYNGYTIFLVKVNDDIGEAPGETYSWNTGSTSLINYFETYIDEVELLTDGLRLNEGTNDAGTMFSYSGEVNRFYFLGKGNDYPWGSQYTGLSPHFAPTYDMYEEFSPTTTDIGDEVKDFYSKMLYGNSYNVIHDCRGMNYYQHWFSMSGKTGEEHNSLENLVFWIPDNRGKYNERNYDEEYLPVVGLYTITLEAEAEQVAYNYVDGNRNYRVDLDWVSSLNSILDFNVDQDYELWIYTYDEQGNPVAHEKVMDLVVNPNGLIHNDTEDYYYVEQKPDSYTIVYRIKGWPKDATNSPGKDPENGTFYALSNLAPVLIPGYENFLSLGVEHYESDFVLDGNPEYAEHNYYRNFLTVANQNPDNSLTAQRISDGEDHYKLYRFDPEDVDDQNQPYLTEAADLLFTMGNNKVEYDITYANQFYVDEANLVHVDDNGVSHNITGYTDPNALGCPTHGEIANISEGGGSGDEPATVTRYRRINSVSDLTSGEEYLIVCENSNVAFDGSLTSLDVSSNTISVSPSNGIIQSNATTDAATFTITANGSSYSIKSKSGYYIGRTSDRNGLNSSTSQTYTNTISFSGNNATIAGQYRYLRYLATSGNYRFRYYGTNSGAQDIQLYKKVEESVGPVGDITITFASGNADFRSITVAGNKGTTSWSFAQYGTSLPQGWSTTKAFSEEDDNSNSCFMSQGGTITVPASLLNGSTAVTVTINAKTYNSQYSSCAVTVPGAETETITITDYSTWNDYIWTIGTSGSGSGTSGNFTLLNDFLNNSTYTQVGIVVFQLPWKSINVKLQEGETASSAGYFKIENGGKLKFIMPAGYNNASLKFVIHNAPVSSEYYDGTFTLVKKSTGEAQTITIPKTANYGDRDYEVIFTGMSSGDVITITGTHTHNGTLYGYSPDFKYIHVFVQGGHDGISMNTALNLDAIKFVDQFKASTKEDKHPYSYGYVLKDMSDGDQSSSPEIPVQHTNSKVDGFYSLDDINNDVNAEYVNPVNAMNAEVNMTLSREPEIFYYTLDRKPSNVNNAQWEAVSKLQKRGNTDSYQEMFDNLPQYEDQICNPPAVTTPPTPWVVERYDNHDIMTGGYNSFMSYVPIIWTHGDQKNRRIKWDIENRHNSYGAPIWKTGVAEVTLLSAVAQRQDNESTKWTYGGEDCSLYMLDNIEAVAKMPTVNNVKYVPYMFRIFVKSKNHKLRGYTTVAAGEDPNLPGEHYVGAPIDNDTLKCVWNGFVNDINNSKFGVTINERTDNGTTFYTFHKNKVDRTEQGGEWDKDVENAIFGSTEDLIQGQGENMMIDKDDLMIIVRFYYLVEGFDASVPASMQRGEGSDPAGYGVQGDGFQPGPSTAVNEITLNASIESVTYVNSLGMTSDKPFDGMNIVITRYSNGAVTTTKVVR